MSKHYWRDIDIVANEFREIEPIVLADMIKAEGKVISDAERAKSKSFRIDDREWLRQLRTAHIASTRQAGMERRMAIDFGEARGWTLSDTTFGLQTLAEGKQHDGSQRFMINGRNKNPDTGMFHTCFDHPQFYRRNRKAAAVAAHLYGMPNCRQECETIAKTFHLIFEVPDFPSWWNPGATTLVVHVGSVGEYHAPHE